jgi:N-acetylglucosaminyldiphosphoundecaprenol N-acetyl-beta-D-mannosaminyltransferase
LPDNLCTLRERHRRELTGEDMGEAGSYLCCGVRIDGLGPEAATRTLLESRYGIARGAHLCNSHTLALAFRDEAYRHELNDGHLNFADGHWVATVGRWRGQKDLTARVYGPALMLATMDRGRTFGLRHYLYGATPETVARLADSLTRRFPGVDIVGTESPPFRKLEPHEEDELTERIALARPDIVWVGIGTPRQDHFVAHHTERLQCTVVPVGAAFDFNSGTKRAAPRFIQRAGMEWLFRFAMEPRRLWRRYLIGIPVFILGVLTDMGRRAARRPVPRPRPAPVEISTPVARPVNGTPVPRNGSPYHASHIPPLPGPPNGSSGAHIPAHRPSTEAPAWTAMEQPVRLPHALGGPAGLAVGDET